MEGEKDINSIPESDGVTRDLLEVRIKNLKNRLDSLKLEQSENTDTEMQQVFEKRIKDVESEISDLESQIN